MNQKNAPMSRDQNRGELRIRISYRPEVEVVEDDCDTGQGSQYDQFAEMMGY